MIDRPRAWVTGAHGLIGSALLRSAARYAREMEVRGLSRATVDLLDEAPPKDLFQRERPALVIHCAAMSRNPACESQPDLARRSNVEVTQRLAELAGDIPFVFLSTDLVFDGVRGGYVEEDAPNPLSVYAETKVLAEEFVRKHPRHLIFRLSLTGGTSREGNRAFNEEMKNAWRTGKTLNLFTDEYRCPGSADVIARAVWETMARKARGTFHLCFSERLSRYEIGQALAEKHPELNPTMRAASRRAYQGPPRPEDTSLNCAKIQELLSFPLPRFTEWLRNDSSGF